MVFRFFHCIVFIHVFYYFFLALLSKTCLNRELRSTKTSSTESILSEQNFTDSPKHVEAAEDPSFGIHVNIFGNIESIDETPNDLGKNDSVYSCKHKDPCLNKFHQNRTYYPAYRSLLFILCYRNDFCIELACPFNYIWNSTLGYCKDQEGWNAFIYIQNNQLFCTNSFFSLFNHFQFYI